MKRYIVVIVVAWITYKVILSVWPSALDPAALEGKNVLITGASSGIGEQMAYIYAKSGANVFITARREESLKKVIEECVKISPRSASHGFGVADLSKNDDRERIIQEAKIFYNNRLDQLILNHAWVPLEHPAWDGSVECFNKARYIMETNFLANVHLVALSFPALLNTNGSVGIVNSVAGRLTIPYTLEYNAAKYALDGYFSGLRREMDLSNTNVSFTIAFLGLIETKSGLQFAKGFVEDHPESLTMPLIVNYVVSTPYDTANAIIGATTRRQRELVHPYGPLVRIGFILRQILPFDII